MPLYTRITSNMCGIFQIYSTFLTFPPDIKPSSIKLNPNSILFLTIETNLVPVACVCPHNQYQTLHTLFSWMLACTCLPVSSLPQFSWHSTPVKFQLPPMTYAAILFLQSLGDSLLPYLAHHRLLNF